VELIIIKIKEQNIDENNTKDNNIKKDIEQIPEEDNTNDNIDVSSIKHHRVTF
jgi:hypothetical protein